MSELYNDFYDNYNDYDEEIELYQLYEGTYTMFDFIEAGTKIFGTELGLPDDVTSKFVSTIHNDLLDLNLSKDDIIYGLSLDGTYEEIELALKKADVPAVIASTLVSMHDVIRKDVLGPNFPNSRESELENYAWKMLPLELTGRDQAQEYLNMLRPALDIAEIKITDEMLDKIHSELDDKTVKMLSEMSHDSLEEMIIADCGRDSGIGCQFKDEEFVNNIVMPDLMERGFGADKDLLDKIQKADVCIEYLENRGGVEIKAPGE